MVANWIGKEPSLTELVLTGCSFLGPVAKRFGNFTSLNTLHLQGNPIEGPVPSLQFQPNQTSLWIEDVNIGSDIRELVGKLANETLEKLQEKGVSLL
jgi:hypothetical protein